MEHGWFLFSCFPVWLLNKQTLAQHFVSNSSSLSLLNIFFFKVSNESLKQKDKHTKHTKPGDTVLSRHPLPDIFRFYPWQKILAAAEMKVRRLKMRRHVWTHILLWAPVGSVYGRRVMYYLELVLPGCLIRAWLREAVTGCFSASAQEWRRSRDQHRSGSILADIQCKTLEIIRPCRHVGWWHHWAT